MRRIVFRILAGAALALAAVVVPATAAHAVSATCQRPLDTPGFGAVQSCTLTMVTPGGRYGRAALRSAVDGSYSYQTGWLPADNATLHQGNSSDGYLVIAGPGLSSDFGPVAFGTQLGPHLDGRFGFWSLYTNGFSPISGWLPRSPT
jgi:hypothetical protein